MESLPTLKKALIRGLQESELVSGSYVSHEPVRVDVCGPISMSIHRPDSFQDLRMKASIQSVQSSNLHDRGDAELHSNLRIQIILNKLISKIRKTEGNAGGSTFPLIPGKCVLVFIQIRNS